MPWTGRTRARSTVARRPSTLADISPNLPELPPSLSAGAPSYASFADALVDGSTESANAVVPLYEGPRRASSGPSALPLARQHSYTLDTGHDERAQAVVEGLASRYSADLLLAAALRAKEIEASASPAAPP